MTKRKKKKAFTPSPAPNVGTVAIYLRVSTEDQTLNIQKDACERWLAENPKYNDMIRAYQDVGISGASTKRPGFMDLMNHCERGKIRAVVVYKLDRLTRDAFTGIGTLLRFDEIGIEFISVTQPMFSQGTPFRRAMIAIFAELAQMEREQIVERVNAGIASAKKRGVVFGRPSKVTPNKKAQILELREKNLSFQKISKAVGLSVGVVHKTCKAGLPPVKDEKLEQSNV